MIWTISPSRNIVAPMISHIVFHISAPHEFVFELPRAAASRRLIAHHHISAVGFFVGVHPEVVVFPHLHHVVHLVQQSLMHRNM